MLRRRPSRAQPAVGRSPVRKRDRGTSTKDQRTSLTGRGCSFLRTPPPARSIMARMDDEHDYQRLGPVDRERPRRRPRRISKWPVDAIKVDLPRAAVKAGDEWNHLFITYDGSAQSLGTSIGLSSTATLQATDSQLTATRLKEFDPQRPFPSRSGTAAYQRSRGSKEWHGPGPVRVYDRALAPIDVEGIGTAKTGPRYPGWPASRPTSRTATETDDALFGCLAGQSSTILSYAEVRPTISPRSTAENDGDPIARDRVTHVMERKELKRRWRICALPRRVRQSAAIRSKPMFHPGRSSPPCRRSFPRKIAWDFARWLLTPATSADRTGHGQSLLAGNLRDGRSGSSTSGDFGIMRRVAVAPRNCLTGWRSSFAKVKLERQEASSNSW